MPASRIAMTLAAGFVGLPALPAAADDYAGKTIDFIVGTPPGGGYDIYARTVAATCPAIFRAGPIW